MLQIRHIDRLILWSISGNGMPSMAPRDLAASCKEWGFIAFIDLMDIFTLLIKLFAEIRHIWLLLLSPNIYRYIEVVVVMTEISYLFSLWGIDEKPHPRRSFILFGFFLFGLEGYSTCQMCFGYLGYSNKASASAGIWCLICCKRSSTRVTLLVKASSSCVRKSMCRRSLALCKEWSARNPCSCFHIF